MSPLEELRAIQHDDLRLASDHALEAFLTEISTDTARLDLIPNSEVELLHLTRIRRTA